MAVYRFRLSQRHVGGGGSFQAGPPRGSVPPTLSVRRRNRLASIRLPSSSVTRPSTLTLIAPLEQLDKAFSRAAALVSRSLDRVIPTPQPKVVIRPFHGAGSVQHQRLAAIRAEHKSREDVRLRPCAWEHVFVLTHLLHDVHCSWCDKGFVGVLHHEPLTLGALHTLLVFVETQWCEARNRVSE